MKNWKLKNFLKKNVDENVRFLKMKKMNKLFFHARSAEEKPSVWPDLAIFCTLGDFLKPLATINLPKSPTFLGNFGKGVKIYHFSSEIIFGQLL